MHKNIIERYFFFGLLLATLLLVFNIFKPFLSVLVISISFTVVLYPLYIWFRKIKFPGWVASLTTIFLFLLLVGGPVLGIGFLVFNQSQDLYQSLSNQGVTVNFLENIENSMHKILPSGINIDLEQKISESVSFLSSNISTIFTSTLSTLLGIFLIIISMFFFLKDGANWKKALILLSPLSDEDDRKIISKLSLSINGIIKGYLLIALIQGTLMGVGLAVFGVPNAALWGVMAGIGSLIPTIGTGLVSVPAVIFLFATGYTGAAIGMAIWAFMIVGWVDNLLNPIIISSKINIPQLLVLFSILGGLALFGAIGFLIGPLAVSLLYALLSIYREEFRI